MSRQPLLPALAARGPTRRARRSTSTRRRPPPWLRLGALAAGLAALLPAAAAAQTCARTLVADVVAFDQVIFYNRLGAFDPAAMIYALRRDVVAESSAGLVAGNVRLRDGKRPRPLVLRMNVGDCLQVKFQNLLATAPVDDEQPVTRHAGVHVLGMQLVNSIRDDGSWVGRNDSSTVLPGGRATYTFTAEREGAYLLYSTGANTGGEGDGGSLARGLFGVVNVEPRNSEWYRSQLTAAELQLATAKDANGVALKTPAGQPVINYNATYPSTMTGCGGCAGLPILKILNGLEIVHSDLTAIITGPNKGPFPAGTYPGVAVYPDRTRPFREFTIVFHDEIGIVQAFPQFEDPKLEFTLHGGRDAFAINYGTGGIGAEILANRFRVGPMHACNDCKFEEFFLSSWAVGDPAMVVDVPANRDANGDGAPDPGPKATRALFPSDPSNVYHAYMNDNVKFRNVHAGPKEHHIFHLHAHQWIHTPDSDNSTYLDSQAIGPGSGYTYEITWGGAGNRNKTPGDAIFHCHFYPHFAMGMWALFRTHDVLETGTVLDAAGKPVAGARALPDGEIAAGTPIPAVVPIPGEPLAPLPNAVANNPGYPFYIPGVAGHRPPKPPLDTRFDGGLPRHVVRGGVSEFPPINRLDFSKEAVTLNAQALPEAGTATEQAAMNFHDLLNVSTYRVDPVTLAVTASSLRMNGRPRVAGAPYADPCVRSDGTPDTTQMRIYKGASFQLDTKFNKAGWHFPQHRMSALWDDVNPTRAGTRAPEPMFLRVNSRDCVEFRLVNLIPKEYLQDDFQVRTPTDVIGQHIHLVKFDVTSSDGAANGFNYEDGSFSPGETRERVEAIRRFNGCVGALSGDTRDGTFTCPVAKAHPFFGAGPNNDWVGAQETVQRWYADDVPNNQGVDRTLRTIFTHDHFGPSTHQQNGLYAGLVAEPSGSQWRNPETGVIMGSRHDGGPTSWRADILTPDASKSYREFNLLFQDFALAYQAGGTTFPDPARAVNPPGKFEVGLPFLLRPPIARNRCPSPNDDPSLTPPCPEIISADDPGTFTVNYRNEPVALRVRDPATNTQAAGTAGDLAFAFSSNVTRADTRLNTQPTFYPALTGGVQPRDPFTPLMRAYQGDQVQVRILVGAHEEGHNFSIQGVKWLFEPSFTNSGYRASQMMGISEHFEFELPRMPKNTLAATADYMWRASTATDGLWNGVWGILRTYRATQANLLALPNNPRPDLVIANIADFNGVCPRTAPVRTADVTAVRAADILSAGTLVYNGRTANGGPLHDPAALMYVRTGDLDALGNLKSGVAIEPLALRFRAGDCIQITLRNQLPATVPDFNGFTTLPMIVDQFNMNQLRPSSHVGLSPQLAFVDVTRDDGLNVGLNPTQTTAPGAAQTLQWYAGSLNLNAARDSLFAQAVEFGGLNLHTADLIKQPVKGLMAATIVEPAGATWQFDSGPRRSSATVFLTDGTAFREFVTQFQSAVNLQLANGAAIPNVAEAEDPEDSGQKGINYRTEPMWFRFGFAPDAPLTFTRTVNFSRATANRLVGADPRTPIFTATAGEQVRFRVLGPGGNERNGAFQVHGHIWQELPWINNSLRLGFNSLSEWKGSQEGLGPSFHFNVLLRNGAGGLFQVPGDYLFRDQASFGFDNGRWGIFRVLAPAPALAPAIDPAAGETTTEPTTQEPKTDEP
ncbi:MAG TPA: hypothetical protein VF746_22045 [Longimicrobium sp.]|jgi:hypothetical protein